MNTSLRRLPALICLIFFIFAFGRPALGQESQSAPLAKELTTLMEQMKLDSVAAKDTKGTDTYVAALYLPGQLLVVNAKYGVPVLLNEKLAKKDYKEIYIDLNSASDPASKCLIVDLGGDGLKAKRDEGKPFDTYERGGKQLAFDGDYKAQKISEQDYTKAFTDADADYSRMLKALIAQLKKGTTD